MRGGNGSSAPQLQQHTSAIVWGDFITGKVIGTLQTATGSVTNAVDGRAALTINVELAEWSLLQASLQPWRHFLAWVTSGWVQAAGPIIAPPSWTPQGVTLTAGGAEAWLGRMEVVPPAQIGALMTTSTVSRGARTAKTATKWQPNPAARTAFTGRAPRAIASSLLDQLMSWGSTKVPTLTHTFYNVGEGGTLTIGWDGIDHKVTADAIADVLAGVEWRLDPYWLDPTNLVLAWDLLVGTPQIIPDPMPIAWPSDAGVTIESVSGDASRMASVSSAVGRSPSGMALNRWTQNTASVPVLMSTVSSSSESDSGDDLQQMAYAGLVTTPELTATISLPVARMHYLPLGSTVAPDWPADAPMSGQVRVVSYSVDLAPQMMSATVIQGGYRGRR